MLVVKAALAALTQRQPLGIPQSDKGGSLSTQSSIPASTGPSSQGSQPCPRCTFQNHPSLLVCEICGASLPLAADKRLGAAKIVDRPESPGPALPTQTPVDQVYESIKFSFRSGGDKIFYERLKNALVQRKWLLQSAPPIPKPRPASGTFDSGSTETSPSAQDHERSRAVGIAGLERRGLEQRKNNEAVIGSAFEDLEALMTSAKEVIALAERFASQANLGTNGSSEASVLASQSASALGLVTTKDMLGSGSESLYVSELSRNLAEYLTDDTRGGDV